MVLLYHIHKLNTMKINKTNSFYTLLIKPLDHLIIDSFRYIYILISYIFTIEALILKSL